MNRAAEHEVQPAELASWVQGNLSEKESERIARHVEACGRCRAEADLAEAHFSTPAGADLGERSARMREEFARRLGEAKVAERSAPTPRRIRAPGGRLWPVLAAAAAVVFAVVGLQQWNDRPQLPQPSGQMRSGTTEYAWELKLDPTSEGWTLDWASPLELSDVEIKVETSTGRLLLRRALESEDETLLRSELGNVNSGEEVFLRVMGVDADGATYESPPWSLQLP